MAAPWVKMETSLKAPCKGKLKNNVYVTIFIKIIYSCNISYKNTSSKILKEDKSELYSYIGSIIKDNESIPVIINGVDDHIHILCVMSKNIALSKFVEEIKRHSSRWIKTKGDHYTKFAWQGGYAGFSLIPSLHKKTKQYIQNQEKHHQKMGFKEEYLLFLKEYGIDYNENYLWSD